MLGKVINVVVFVPLGIILIVLCVANRQSVKLAFNPFDPADTVLAFNAPFYVFLFLALILGLLIGAAATWFSQGKYRRRARTEASEALKWHQEAEKRRAEAAAAQPAPAPAAAPTLSAAPSAGLLAAKPR
jgi:uncharacterized integral membrane protein